MKLTLDEKLLIADSVDAIKAATKLMHQVIERHTERLLSEPVDEVSSGARLVVLRARIDGMKALINEYEALIAKNNKS